VSPPGRPVLSSLSLAALVSGIPAVGFVVFLSCPSRFFFFVVLSAVGLSLVLSFRTRACVRYFLSVFGARLACGFFPAPLLCYFFFYCGVLCFRLLCRLALGSLAAQFHLDSESVRSRLLALLPVSTLAEFQQQLPDRRFFSSIKTLPRSFLFWPY